MRNRLLYCQLAGFIFTAIAGTLLHFLYDWSNHNVFVAPFSAVNESIWEHMKLLFVPMFTFALIERQFIGAQYENFWCVKLVGILFGIIMIPVLYYTYTGIYGMSKDWINIIIFFVVAAATYLLEMRLFKKDNIFCITPLLALLILCLLALTFVVFTFIPPEIPLFEASHPVSSLSLTFSLSLSQFFLQPIQFIRL